MALIQRLALLIVLLPLGACVILPPVEVGPVIEITPNVVQSENIRIAYQSDPCFLNYSPRWTRIESDVGYLVFYFDSTRTVDIVLFRHTQTPLSEDRLRVEGLTLFGADELLGPWTEAQYTIVKNEETTAAWYYMEISAEFDQPVDYIKLQIEGQTAWTPHIAKVVLQR